MTSQIAMLNHLGVALASDSAVTMGTSGRTFSSVNKIFSLAGRQPIAIMVSGRARYIPGDVSWERVVGMFREHIGSKEFPKLNDYVEEFQSYVTQNPELNSKSSNDVAIQESLVDHFTDEVIRQASVREQVLTHQSYGVRKMLYDLPDVGNHLSREIQDRIENVFDQVQEKSEWEFVKNYWDSKEDYENHCYRIQKRHNKNVKLAAENFCKRHECSKAFIPKMKSIFLFHLISYGDRFNWQAHSRLAFGGFGENQISPEITICKVGVNILDSSFGEYEYHQIRHRESFEDDGDLRKLKDSEGNYFFPPRWSASSLMMPFAMTSELDTTLNGINQKNERELGWWLPDDIEESVSKLLIERMEQTEGIGKATMEKISNLLETSKDDFREKIREEVKQGLLYTKRSRRAIFRSACSSLPLEELAGFAETLVSLEANITHYSKDVRSVGGPIDLATITKEDGFLWVNSKHHVDSSKNPRQLEVSRNSANVR